MVTERSLNYALKNMRVIQQILAANNLVPDVFADKFPQEVVFADLDEEVLKALMDSYWFERARYLWGLERCVGEDKELARFEKLRLKEDLEAAGVELEDVFADLDKVKKAKAVLAKFAEQPLTTEN